MGIKKIGTQYKQKNNSNFFHGYLKKGITLFYVEKGAANIENTTFAARVFITILNDYTSKIRSP